MMSSSSAPARSARRWRWPLAAGDVDVTILDGRPAGQTPRGDRSLALSHGARLILERIGVWDALSATPGALTPIVRIDISQAGGFGQTQLAADEHGIPGAGLRRQLSRAAGGARCGARALAVWHCGTASTVAAVRGTSAHAAIELRGRQAIEHRCYARLAAVADGTGDAMASIARQRHDYRQVALVAKLWRAAPHDGTAFERFTPRRSDGAAAGARRLRTRLDGDAGSGAGIAGASTIRDFLAELARHFGARAGGFTRVADRRTFPLVLEFAREPARARCVALGNAAQTLHPVAGQGFNVGLRDAWELAQIVLDTPREQIGDDAMLRRYSRGRRTDRMAGIAFTHGLVRLFGNDLPLVRWPRGLALTLLDAVPAAKRAFTRAMLFGVR